MKLEPLETILECMPQPNQSISKVQNIQTAHRLKLAEFWEINAGARILEIGCGQGDTTAVLAYMVGEEGFVHGVDITRNTFSGKILLYHRLISL